MTRLQKELMALMMSSEKSVSAFPEDSNFFRWKVIVKLMKKTSLSIKICKSLIIGNDYWSKRNTI
jgi:ubiquitin-protein ligase